MKTKEIPPPTAQPTQPTISRAQRRFQERIEHTARRTYDQLAEQFLECFLEHSPESEEVTEKAKEVDAKWKMVCRKMKLNEKARDLMQKYCDSVFEDYKKEKD